VREEVEELKAGYGLTSRKGKRAQIKRKNDNLHLYIIVGAQTRNIPSNAPIARFLAVTLLRVRRVDGSRASDRSGKAPSVSYGDTRNKSSPLAFSSKSDGRPFSSL
jgi:hypothetical protein